MRYDNHRVFTLSDLERHAADLGLEVVSCEHREPGTVRVVVKAGPPSEVIRRPPYPERVDLLRERIARGGAVGVWWTVLTKELDDEIREAIARSREEPAQRSLGRMKMNPLQTVAVIGAITLTVGAMIAILVYGFANL